MPELPEVRTVVSNLNRYYKGKILTNINVSILKSLKNITPQKLSSLSKNTKLKEVTAKGKYIVFNFENFILIAHLRLEGKFTLEKTGYEIAIFTFKDKKLYFSDFRKFATLEYFDSISYAEEKSSYGKIGPEPWDVEKAIFAKQLKKSSAPIKTVLLNQKYISGLGNIYVDEVLYHSKVLPTRKGKTLSQKEISDILKYSISILKKAVELKGTTIRTYNSMSEKGSYQDFLKVHTKTGAKCGKNSYVVKTKVGGRGTYFCPGVQK